MAEEPAILKSLRQALEADDGKNYDPRMEELMRSDKLIDPKAENLAKLEEQEVYHIAKIRGAQTAFKITVRKLKRLYETPEMMKYSTPYMDYIRSLKEDNPNDRKELDMEIGGLPVTNEMISQLICLTGAFDAWKAKLYADSIKPVVSNQPIPFQQPQQEQEGLFSKVLGFMFGKKDQPSGQTRR